ncbi:MAG TPA: lysophospholipid acyltransferase family protein [Polyangiaceae bacterium]|nr:lysophospholipid acyltransferase family protein [Polyangiaceae bacterium]
MSGAPPTDASGRDRRLGGRWSPAQRAKNDLLYVLASGALGAARGLGAPSRRALARLVADACWALGVGWRRRVERNLRLALGPNAPGARAVFRGLGSVLADTLALLEGGAAAGAGLELEGEAREALRAGLSGGRGVMYATAHLGPWERMAALLVEEGFDVVTVARESYDPRFDALYARLRDRRGVRALYRGRPGFAAALVRALKRGTIVGFPMDLAGRGVRAHEARWFGLPLATPLGPAALALRTGASLVVGTPAPGPGGSLVVRVEAVETAGLGAGPGEVERLTERLAGLLAARVAALPTLWPWMHPKWLRLRAPRVGAGARAPPADRKDAAAGAIWSNVSTHRPGGGAGGETGGEWSG